jgi:hypothetical protein
VGVIVWIDFSNFHMRACASPLPFCDSASSSLHSCSLLSLSLSLSLSWRTGNESDYEWWYPDDGEGTNCLMGRKVGYKRRKQHAECYNGEITDIPKFVSNCPCSDEDFEWYACLCTEWRRCSCS